MKIQTNVAGLIMVDTGAAQFELSTTHFSLFEQVTVDGVVVIESLGRTNAVVYADVGGTSIVSATTNRPARPLAVAVERAGPQYAVIKAKGSILNDNHKPVLDFTARYHFRAGASDVQVDFTLENNLPVIEGEWGQQTNVHDHGSTNSVYIGSLQLLLQLAGSPSVLHALMEAGVEVTAPIVPLRLYQDSSGLSSWNNYVGLVGWENNVACAPRLQSFCSLPGYVITGAGNTVTGRQALGWATLYREGNHGPRLQVAVRDFWQNFPKAVEARPNGEMVVDLFPNGKVFSAQPACGRTKTASSSVPLRAGTGNA